MAKIENKNKKHLIEAIVYKLVTYCINLVLMSVFIPEVHITTSAATLLVFSMSGVAVYYAVRRVFHIYL